MQKVLFTLMVSFHLQYSFAQHFIKTNQLVTDPTAIIIKNYSPISLINEKYLPDFDSKNSYTFIQKITDQNNTVYHVLYQTDFFGTINFIALSNDLWQMFNCNKVGLLSFYSCNHKHSSSNFSMEIIDNVINCILERLNYCTSEN